MAASRADIETLDTSNRVSDPPLYTGYRCRQAPTWLEKIGHSNRGQGLALTIDPVNATSDTSATSVRMSELDSFIR